MPGKQFVFTFFYMFRHGKVFLDKNPPKYVNRLENKESEKNYYLQIG